MPNTIIVLGGPEVSYDFDEYLGQVDFIAIGEGEATIKELIEFFLFSDKSISDIKGISYKKDDKIIVNEAREPLSLDSIPFAYQFGLEGLDNKIIYYETSRGCPYSCQYCLSSIDKQLRFLSMPRVEHELKIFLDENVRQVKFIDRTFNCNKNHAMGIWKFLIENDNGITNFHFEISADLLTEEMLSLLDTARQGLFQFEIGVQSTNTDTLSIIKRKSNLEKLFKSVGSIGVNIDKHLDLIIGLPNENYESFRNSFNTVYNLNPNQLQIGFLKLLKGSGLRQDVDKYGIAYKDKAPYEVLYTNDISFEEILRLKYIEDMVDIFYNSNKFDYTIKFIINYFSTPFDFYSSLADFWEKNNYHTLSHNKMALFSIMRDFILNELPNLSDEIEDLLKFDMYLNDNIKNPPTWIRDERDEKIKEKVKIFYQKEEHRDIYFNDLFKYTSQQLSRICHIEVFRYNVVEWIEKKSALKRKDTYILFKYAVKGESEFDFFEIEL